MRFISSAFRFFSFLVFVLSPCYFILFQIIALEQECALEFEFDEYFLLSMKNARKMFSWKIGVILGLHGFKDDRCTYT